MVNVNEEFLQEVGSKKEMLNFFNESIKEINLFKRIKYSYIVDKSTHINILDTQKFAYNSIFEHIEEEKIKTRIDCFPAKEKKFKIINILYQQFLCY